MSVLVMGISISDTLEDYMEIERDRWVMGWDGWVDGRVMGESTQEQGRG